MRQLATGILVVVLGCAGVVAVHAEERGTANSCSDPYWANTLRCEWLAFEPPPQPQPPQPVPQPPANVGEIKAYTRVELTNPSVRCVDGTRPILYVDRAVGAPSNRWLISTTGGEYCAAEDLDHDIKASFESGQECVDKYDAQNTLLMGTAYEPAMSNLADDERQWHDVAERGQINPVFARYNRVRVHKCGFDRHSGRAPTTTSRDAARRRPGDHLRSVQPRSADRARSAHGAAGTGGNGLSFPTWVNVGGVVTPAMQSLPSIAAAEQVVFIGHSAAAHGLYQNADRLADLLREMPGFNGDVRVVHDAQFMPAVENEAAFDPAQNADPATINTLFDQRMSGHTLASGDYDSYRYHGNALSPFAEDYRAWLGSGENLTDVLDTSCVAAHTAADEEWKCVDRFHVRLHHESTSAFLREDFADMNGDHNNAPWGHVMWWGELGIYSHCNGMVDGGIEDLFPYSPCPPTISVAQNRARLIVQAAHFREGIFSMAENVLNADPGDDPGSIFVWMPECGWHTGAYNDDQFYGTSILKNGSMKSYREFLQDFVAAPPTGVLEYRVTYLDGAQSECGPQLLKDSFD